MRSLLRGLLAIPVLVVALPLGGLAAAQANVVPGTDVQLGALGGLNNWAHQGSFPNGLIGVSMSTTACNAGSVAVPWQNAMDEDHPLIAFLFARESNGRMVQISDRSYVKHGFYALSNSQCTPCQGGSMGGNFLGIGCSDTYGTGSNGDNYWLGPPEEIDPWLGSWTAACSHFDRGEPAVAPPQDCDGSRSLSASMVSAMGPIGHRVQIGDADLNVPGADFWYQAQYVVRGEPRDARANNLGSRRMLATWNGNDWNVGVSGSLLLGSVLQRWSGASVASGGNGLDDGRFVIAVTASDNGNGTWHYEYAVHNVDNLGGGALRIPLSPGATVSNAGFRDIDGLLGNDWTIAQAGDELVYSTPDNPLAWNTIYNYWFDCDAAPLAGRVVHVDQLLAGSGAPTVAVPSTTPEGGACPPPAVYCTAKLNSSGCAAPIASSGGPSASAGSGFSVSASLVVANTNGLLFYSKLGPDGLPFQGGYLCAAAPVRRTLGQSSGGAGACGGAFDMDFNVWIAGGNDLELTPGQQVWAQYWYRDPGSASTTGLSDALTFVVCP